MEAEDEGEPNAQGVIAVVEESIRLPRCFLCLLGPGKQKAHSHMLKTVRDTEEVYVSTYIEVRIY